MEGSFHNIFDTFENLVAGFCSVSPKLEAKIDGYDFLHLKIDINWQLSPEQLLRDFSG